MSTTRTYSGNFEGRKAAGYIAPMLYGGRTLGTPAVTIHENIKYKLNVRGLDVSDDILRDATCDFSPTSTITSGDTVLQPKEMQVNLQVCFDDWYDQWEAEQINGSRLDGNAPREWMDFLNDRISERIAKRIETLVWTGANTTNQFEGFITKLGAPNIVAGSVTKSNVIAEMQKVYDAINEDVWDAAGTDGLVFAVGTKIDKFYQQAVAEFGGTGSNGYRGEAVVGEKPRNFMGLDITRLPGLPDNVMVAYPKADLHFGSNLLTDFTNIKVVDTRETLADNNLRFTARFAAGTQVTNRTNIVYYGASI